MEAVDCVVVGAGVVGLAIARELARGGREVLVLEQAGTIGTGTSSRNSEVIHAGIYYPAHLAKARWCVQGRRALYRFCDEYGVPLRRCGKLIVATDDAQRPALADLQRQAQANGVDDLAPLTPQEAGRLEPAVRCVAALLSPSSGIVDSHAYMLALQGDAQRHGAVFAFGTHVAGGMATPDGIELATAGAETLRLRARTVVNSAGLGAQALASAIDGVPPASIPPLHLSKGSYFVLAGRNPFSHLVYPMPEPGGLGVHVTIDLGGQARFGPDVQWIDAIDYDVDPRRAALFYAAVRRYWPDLADGALVPGYAGIRPKVERPGGSNTDFLVRGPADHGVPGLVCLFGIESPGLTASLAIARYVAGLVAG
jgi:L-2-hydroxyglutarate oxidase LhgO